MTTRAHLLQEISSAKKQLDLAESNLAEFDNLAENNVFSTIEEALDELTATLLDEADAACAGAYNCGSNSYSRQFMVDGKKYLFLLDVEYNRHDKTYYYIDGHKASYKELSE